MDAPVSEVAVWELGRARMDSREGTQEVEWDGCGEDVNDKSRPSSDGTEVVEGGQEVELNGVSVSIVCAQRKYN